MPTGGWNDFGEFFFGLERLVAARIHLPRPNLDGDVRRSQSSLRFSEAGKINTPKAVPSVSIYSWVISGHCGASIRCPLYPRKRTFVGKLCLSPRSQAG